MCVCVCICSRECVFTRMRVSRLVFRSGNRFLSSTLSFSYSTTRLCLDGRVYTGFCPHTPVWLPSIPADCGPGGRVPGPEKLDPLSQTKTAFSIHHYTYIYTSLECVCTIDVQRDILFPVFFSSYTLNELRFFSAPNGYTYTHTHLNPYYIPYS